MSAKDNYFRFKMTVIVGFFSGVFQAGTLRS